MLRRHVLSTLVAVLMLQEVFTQQQGKSLCSFFGLLLFIYFTVLIQLVSHGPSCVFFSFFFLFKREDVNRNAHSVVYSL